MQTKKRDGARPSRPRSRPQRAALRGGGRVAEFAERVADAFKLGLSIDGSAAAAGLSVRPSADASAAALGELSARDTARVRALADVAAAEHAKFVAEVRRQDERKADAAAADAAARAQLALEAAEAARADREEALQLKRRYQAAAIADGARIRTYFRSVDASKKALRNPASTNAQRSAITLESTLGAMNERYHGAAQGDGAFKDVAMAGLEAGARAARAATRKRGAMKRRRTRA